MSSTKQSFQRPNKTLLENYFSLTFLQMANFALPLLTLPYLVKTLGPEKFGLVMFAQAFIVFFDILVDFGFKLSATREISVHRDDSKKVTEIFSAIMIIKGALLIVAFSIFTILILSFDNVFKDIKLYLLSFSIVLGQAMFPIWYFQGIEKMKLIALISVLSKLVFTVSIFFVVKNQGDYLYVPLLNGIGFIFGGVISLLIISKVFHQKIQWVPKAQLKHYFVDSSQYFLSRVSVTLYTASNAFVLGILTNNTMVGYYAIAEKLYQALKRMYQPIVQTLYPYIAKYNNIKLFKKLFFSFVFLNIIGIVILFFLSESVFTLLFTKSIASQSLEVFHVFLLASLVVVPSIFLGYPFLGALGFSKYANLSVVYGSILHVCGLALLALFNNINIYTVAYMVVTTETLVLIIRIYWIKKENLWQK